jgi:hypothetical protein
MRKWTTVTPVVAAFAISAAAYSRMPERGPLDVSPLVPFSVTPSGATARLGIALLVPATALGVWLLLSLLAGIRGPVRGLPQWWLNEHTGSEALRRFEPTYNTIAFGVTALLALIHAAVVASFIGAASWIYPALTFVTGVGMIAVGNIFPRVRPNWIVGLRTKRTLSNPQTWARVHRLAGALTIMSGSLMIAASLLAPRYALVVGFVALLLSLPLAYLIAARGHPTAPLAGMGK